VTKKTYTNKPNWLIDKLITTAKKLDIEIDETAQKIEFFGPRKTIIPEECPECHAKEMYFYTMQLRSADEGSTVFYECVRCP